MTLWRRARLAVKIWTRYLEVQRLLRRRLGLPVIVATLKEGPSRPAAYQDPRQLGRSVARALKIGSAQPRCLTMALVHYSLLLDKGLPAELVIGLPASPTSPEAHAWIELDGVDIGPPPGRHGHHEMARY